MLQNKRNQIRENIRSQEIKSLFQLRRKELIKGTITIFRDLDHEICSQEPSMNEQQLCKALYTCLQNYPEEENTYIIIGNYISWNNNSYSHFFTLLTQSPKYLQNQMWCFKVIACIIHEQLAFETWNHKDKIEQMEQLVSVACMNMNQMFQKLKRNQYSTQKDIQMWFYFMQILRVQLNNHIFHEFSEQPIAIFSNILSTLPIHENKGDLKEIQETWRCLKDIILIYDRISIKKELLASSWSIFWLVLQQLGSQREDCLKILHDLLTKHSIDFMGVFFNQKMLKQILYIFDQIPALRPLITQFIKNLLPMCTIDQLLYMLNKGIHKSLTKTMQWSIENRNNESLQNSMAAIYFMLQRFQNFQETRLLRRILNEIEDNNFYLMLQGLNKRSQNQMVQKYLNLLIDDFYSQDCEI